MIDADQVIGYGLDIKDNNFVTDGSRSLLRTRSGHEIIVSDTPAEIAALLGA